MVWPQEAGKAPDLANGRRYKTASGRLESRGRLREGTRVPKLKRQRAFTGFVDRRLTGDTLGSVGSVGVECPLERFVKPLRSQSARNCIEMLVSATCNRDPTQARFDGVHFERRRTVLVSGHCQPTNQSTSG